MMDDRKMPEKEMAPPMATEILTDEEGTGAEARLLMSLALDGLLDSGEEERLNELLAAHADLGEEWRCWQKMDTLFTGALRVVPAEGFGDRFALRLDQHEARLRRRQRLILGVVTMVGWIGTLAALLCVGWMILSSQSQWMNGMARELVYYPAALGIWMRAMLSSLNATMSEPQSIAIATGYLALTGSLLYGWVRILRRTTREEVIS